MGHRVAVLRDGTLQQVATPEELYERPVNTFVASFIGSPAITMVESPVREGVASVHGAKVPLSREIAARAGEKVIIGLRPESWHLVDSEAADSVPIRVELVEALGAESFIYGTPSSLVDDDSATPDRNRVTVRLDKRSHLQVGEVVHVAPEAQEAHVFDAESGVSLRP